MRLWSLAPTQLDRAALVAGWREGLLAQKVLAGGTTGYRNHPQLIRFRDHGSPQAAIAAWLLGLADEADARGYRFNRALVPARPCEQGALTVTDGQLELERRHLLAKVLVREPAWASRLEDARPHPLFRVVPGGTEPWERAALP